MAGRRRKLSEEIRRSHPGLVDPEEAIVAGHVVVDGRIVTNPRSLVRVGASISVAEPTELRGSTKLRAALRAFDVSADGRVALDVGAAAGGFTQLLLDSGAERVYAVDVGHGQLLGSLRQDPRVVHLEATNVAELTTELVPQPVELVTVDVSYLSLADAVRQLAPLEFGPDCDLLGLVKPMFELRLGSAPTDEASLREATSRARLGIESAGWEVRASVASAVTGARGAIEGWIHARRPVGARA